MLFLDDLHWIDPGSDAVLGALDRGRAEHPHALLVNFRPEYQAEWMRKPYYQQLPLLPLGPEAIAEMLADLLGADPSVRKLPAYVHGRTGGNPFFIEEVVQSLLEAGRSGRASNGAYRLVGVR